MRHGRCRERDVRLQCILHPPLHSRLLRFNVDRLNDTYACDDDKALNDILKREYGFKGCEPSY
jgi:beta-glucosidase-like glycosyl hydrolase